MQETYSLYNYYFDQYLPGDDHYFWLKVAPWDHETESAPRFSYGRQNVYPEPYPVRSLEYSLDLINWHSLSPNTAVEFDTVIYLRSPYTSSQYSTQTSDNNIHKEPINLNVNKPFSAGGNIDLLIFKDDVPLSEANLPADSIGVTNNWSYGPFACLFYNRKNLVSARCIKFHEGTVMKPWMFFNMFTDCINLKRCFTLPPGDFYEGCCHEMFKGCTNLQEIPKINNSYMVSSNTTDGYGNRANPVSSINFMFMDCDKIKFNSQKLNDSYNAYTFPTVKPNSYWDNVNWDDNAEVWLINGGYTEDVTRCTVHPKTATPPLTVYTTAKVRK